MYDYFKRKLSATSDNNIPNRKTITYRNSVVTEMKRMGANASEISLLQDETIKNSIRNGRNPEEVAWAILQ